MLVWLNGHLLAGRGAHVAALDRGLLHGDGLYDTWRTYGGAPFAIREHVRRLATGARRLGLPEPGSAAVWEARTRQLVARNALLDAAVRLTITRGPGGAGLEPAGGARPTLLLLARPLPPDLTRRQQRGVKVVLLPFPREAAPPWGGLKLLGHASAVVGRALAGNRGAAEGLYTTPAGHVTEGTATNLFAVERGRLVTPPADGTILPGVTRALVMRLAHRAGIPVLEQRLDLRRVERACELFLTASTIEVLPVVRLGATRVGSGRPGPVTQLLQARYAAHVAASLRPGHRRRSRAQKATRRRIA